MLTCVERIPCRIFCGLLCSRSADELFNVRCARDAAPRMWHVPSTMSVSRDFALWIRAKLPADKLPLTHLKLQKLMFYGYGAALAFDCERALGGKIAFEAWEHGPVNREVWKEYKDHGSRSIDSNRPSARQ